MIDVASMLADALRDPRVASALREAFGSSTASTWIPLDVAAEQIGVRVRVLRDAARRGDLAVHGPRGARVVTRGDLDAWILAHRIERTTTTSAANDVDDERAEARAAVARAAVRVRGSK